VLPLANQGSCKPPAVAGAPAGLSWTYTITGCPDTLAITIDRSIRATHSQHRGHCELPLSLAVQRCDSVADPRSVLRSHYRPAPDCYCSEPDVRLCEDVSRT
jgi:hypothetical protein